jgi:flagellar hook-associated protein 1 FlgK
MAIFAPLAIGRQALLANERAIGVTGHNIANANTPGYSRQRAVLSAERPDQDGFGSGVRMIDVERAVDPLLDARLLVNASALGGAITGHQLLDRLQAFFPVGDRGVGNALAEFFAAANALADNPQDLASRNQLLEAAHAVASQLRSAAGGIQTLQREADERLGQAAFDANAVLEQVAHLNREIVAAEQGGRATNDLRDQRQAALGELAGQLAIQVIETADGGVDVVAASGQAVVMGADAATLTTEPDGSQLGLDGNPLSRVGIRLPGGAVVALAGSIGGAIGALLDVRDRTLPGNAADLDRLAVALRDSVNAVQTDPAGRDLNGAVGLAFFSGTGAADLAVAISDPRGIAAARSTELSDNSNALALAAVAQQTFPALGGATLSTYFGTVHARIGQQARGADDAQSIQENVSAALSAQREAISGVSLDEEFTDLIRFQRAFQAAAQLINVSNTMLDDLLGLVSS